MGPPHVQGSTWGLLGLGPWSGDGRGETHPYHRLLSAEEPPIPNTVGINGSGAWFEVGVGVWLREGTGLDVELGSCNLTTFDRPSIPTTCPLAWPTMLSLYLADTH